MFFSGWIVVGAVLLFWAVGAYNRLMRLRSAALQAFGALDAELLRRIALLGEYDAAVTGPRKPVEAELHEALHGAMTQYAASLAVSRSKPLDAAAAQALTAAATVLDASWQALVKLAEQHVTPEDELHEADASAFSMAPWIQSCQKQNAQIERATEQFNAAVMRYNHAVSQFPANLLGWLFGFKQAREL